MVVFLFLLWFSMVMIVITGCTSIPISLDKKCKMTNVAGDSWASNDLTNVMTFNNDCSGMILVRDNQDGSQLCTRYFTYEMTDYATVFLNFKDSSIKGMYGIKTSNRCPYEKGIYKCTYSLAHLTESNMEVMDINCAWSNKLEQLTRYEK